MAVSIADRINLAFAAGFRDEGLVVVVAISLCECGVGSPCETGCNPDCCPQGESCGVLQVFQPAHPGTMACAVDPACAFTLGWSISSHGTSFTPWSTFNNGCYLSHLAEVRAVLAALTSPAPPPPAPRCPPGTQLNDLGTVCVPIAPPPPPAPAPEPAPAPPPSPSAADNIGAVILVILASAALVAREVRRRPELVSRVEHLHVHPAPTRPGAIFGR